MCQKSGRLISSNAYTPSQIVQMNYNLYKADARLFFFSQVTNVPLQQHFQRIKNSGKYELLRWKWICCTKELTKAPYTLQALSVQASQTEDSVCFAGHKCSGTAVAFTVTTINVNMMYYMGSLNALVPMFGHPNLMINALEPYVHCKQFDPREKDNVTKSENVLKCPKVQSLHGSKASLATTSTWRHWLLL